MNELVLVAIAATFDAAILASALSFCAIYRGAVKAGGRK